MTTLNDTKRVLISVTNLTEAQRTAVGNIQDHFIALVDTIWASLPESPLRDTAAAKIVEAKLACTQAAVHGGNWASAGVKAAS